MPNTKTVTTTTNPTTGIITRVTETDGVRATATVSNSEHLNKAAAAPFHLYKQQKVWNPSTNAFITVNMTGDPAQDELLMAAAFATAGTQSKSLISTT